MSIEKCPECNSEGTFRSENQAYCAKCGHGWESVGEDYDTVVGEDCYGEITASQSFNDQVGYWTSVAKGSDW
jgi:uncharacterized Zn ribbon protein